jgi:hypothetical protein
MHPPERKSGHWRNFFSKPVPPQVVLTVTTVCAVLAISELSLRLFLGQKFLDFNRMQGETLAYDYDRRLGWFPAPNSKKEALCVSARTIAVSHNCDGFRDPEPVFDQRPSIVFLGDSFTWGYNVESTERFTEVLRQRHRDWRVCNWGVVGYGNDQEYVLLRKDFERYQPQVVFLVFCTENDHVDNCGNGGGLWYYKPYFYYKCWGS